MIFPGTLGLSFEAQFPSEQDPFSILPLRAISSLEPGHLLFVKETFSLASSLKALFLRFSDREGRGGNFDFTAVKFAPSPRCGICPPFHEKTTQKP